MGHSCTVIICKNNTNNSPVKFYTIPAVVSPTSCKHKKEKLESIIILSKKRQNAWVRALNQGPLSSKELNHKRVCAGHFQLKKPAALEDQNHPDWVPNQKLGYRYGQALKNYSDVERHERSVKRSFVLNYTLQAKECVMEEFSSLDDFQNINNDNDNGKVDVSTQTDINIMDLEDITDSMRDLQIACDDSDKALRDLQKKMNDFLLGEETFLNDDNKTKFFTGIASSETLFQIHELIHDDLVVHIRTHLTTFQILVLSLMKLRLNFSYSYLSYRFGVSIYTVGRYFRRVVNILYKLLHPLVYWPDRGLLHATMPQCFREAYGQSITVIVDCFEVFMQRPENLASRAVCWSNYKHHCTAKHLIGITPQGTICFISKSWGGRASDKYITKNSGFLDNLIHGDVVMADRGFTIEDSVGSMGATLKMPAFTKGKNQLHPMQLEETRTLANVRIHVERVIGAARQKFQILSGTVPISLLVTTSVGVSAYMIRLCMFVVH